MARAGPLRVCCSIRLESAQLGVTRPPVSSVNTRGVGANKYLRFRVEHVHLEACASGSRMCVDTSTAVPGAAEDRARKVRT